MNPTGPTSMPSPEVRTVGGARPYPVRGVLWLMLGLLLFACMDSTTKYLVSRYEVPLVVAVRYIGNSLLMILLLAPTQGRRLIRTRRSGLVVLRASCLAGASLLIAMAFQRMPIAEATAIVFLAPLLVMLLAGPVLGEHAGVVGWLAALAGFGGILLIAHPGAEMDLLGTLYALGAAVLTAIYQLLSRVLASTETTLAMLFYTALIGSIAYGLYLPWSWGGPLPELFTLGLFLALGAMGGLGHFLFTAAHRDAPTSVLAPMMYAQLLWAALLGWLVFDHVPAAMSLVGMGIIVLSGLLIGLRSRLGRRVRTTAGE